MLWYKLRKEEQWMRTGGPSVPFGACERSQTGDAPPPCQQQTDCKAVSVLSANVPKIARKKGYDTNNDTNSLLSEVVMPAQEFLLLS